ncbi:regulatory protein RecX [Bifidobacterium magnum]|uniref:regulatory protein RecX n=1 Tax=Bifidobacterium magnum TaxID=1692 RepID=UPI0004268181|nr:regulatory protein RecX [Bifidobacterium magnum]
MISAEEFLRNRANMPGVSSDKRERPTPGPGLGPRLFHQAEPAMAPEPYGSVEESNQAADQRADCDDPSDPFDHDGSGRGARSRRGAFRVAQAGDPSDAEACKEAALRLLDAAARPTGALRIKLADRGYDPQVIEATIDRLVYLQLVDDEDYARQAVDYCVRRNMGEYGVIRELERKGVDQSLARRIAHEAAQQGVFVDALWQLGRAVARKTQGLDLQVRRRRFWSTAGRKGHNPQSIREVSEELFTDSD